MELVIGSHVSFINSKGLVGSVEEALKYGANTFMIYTGTPQNTIRDTIDKDKVKEGKQLMEKSNIDVNNVIVHAPYIVNLANNKDLDKYNFSINFLRQELKRVEDLGLTKMVLHPGSHVGLMEEEAISNIVSGLNKILDKETGPIICLETMAGKGTEVGKTFEELKEIIDGVKNNHRLMVCLDTCHIHDAGYDLNDFDKVLEEFDEVIGLSKISCMHINDSKNLYGSHKDRHANIGFGEIGFDNLLNIIYHEKLKGIPKILETPYVKTENNSYPPYKEEIEMIKNKKFNPNLIENIINHNK